MKINRTALSVVGAFAIFSSQAAIGQSGQQTNSLATVPVATQWTLAALPSEQKATVKSVLLIECRKMGRKGTAFLLKSGIVVTNFHVVQGCTEQELWARSPMGPTVAFAKMVTDEKRDLAILKPTELLRGGLELGPDTEPVPEAKVKTWGYPLSYEGLPPILSVGYVAGYPSIHVSTTSPNFSCLSA
jgi:S1-C subfamily serine protease